MTKLAFVGGHHTAALAVIDALPQGEYQVFWIGHRYSMWGDRTDCAEFKEVTSRGIPFFDLKAGKFYRTYHPLKLLRIPWGFLQAFYFLLQIRPELVVSFGGYLSVPVAFCAWVLGIPILAHEQTVTSGLANRVVALFAKQILLSWPQSIVNFPRERCIVVGLPLRKELSLVQRREPSLPTSEKRPLIYITGGKQGAHVINEVVYAALPSLLRKYKVVHQCGSSSVYNDLEKLRALKLTLPRDLSSSYVVSAFFDGQALADIFNEVDLVVSRSGGNICYELLAFGIPSILIPIPWVSHNEQQKNAEMLVGVGIGRILPQADLSPRSLESEVDKMVGSLEEFREGAKRAKNLVVYDAAQKIAAEIAKITSGK